MYCNALATKVYSLCMYEQPIVTNSQLADHSAVQHQNLQQPVSRLMHVDLSMHKSWKRFKVPFQNLCHGLYIPTRRVICKVISVNFVSSQTLLNTVDTT